MPSKSEAQARLMRAAAHDKKIADANGIDQALAKEWVRKDQEQQQKQKDNAPKYTDW